jgi:hypothetical protein
MNVQDLINKYAGTKKKNNSGVPMTVQDLIQKYQNYTPPPPPPPPQTRNRFLPGSHASTIPIDQTIPSQVGSQASQGWNQMKQGFGEIMSGKENPVQAVESGLKTEAGVAGAVTSPLAPILKPIGAAVDFAGNIGNTMGNIANKIPGVHFNTQKYDAANANYANSSAGQGITRVATDLSNAGAVAGTILGAKSGVDNIGDAWDAVKKSTTDAVSSKITDNMESDWKKPSTLKQETKYTKAQGVAAKDPTIPRFLAEQKIDPKANIEDGKYSTADTADNLRATAGKLSEDVIKPALKLADYLVKPGAISDILNAAKNYLGKTFNVTAGDVESITKNIEKEADALTRKYPNGIKLSDADTEKITYAKNGGFSPFKSASDTNLSIANRAISSALGDFVEKNAPESVHYGEFKDYLSKYYKGADYLDALNGKKVPYSLGKYIAHRGLQVIGAGIGQATGFGMLADVGGYMIGGAVEHALENLPNPLRNMFLSNIETTNPAVFAKIQQFLQNPNGGMLALPPATNQTPMITPNTRGTPGINYNLPKQDFTSTMKLPPNQGSPTQ